MGKYEDCCFTLRPENQSVDEVADAVEDFIERPLERLPGLPDRITEYTPTEEYYERDRMRFETDEDRGQVYLGARTHSTTNKDAWRCWLRELGIGDGLLAFVWWHETPLQGYAELWTWDDTSGEYVPLEVDELETEDVQYEVYLGEEGAQGAMVARRLAEVADVEPARHDEFEGFLLPGDQGFVPQHYRERRGDSFEE